MGEGKGWERKYSFQNLRIFKIYLDTAAISCFEMRFVVERVNLLRSDLKLKKQTKKKEKRD